MSIRYYLSIFPMEAFIASMLEPVQFGTYMATGSKKGSAEQLIFCEINGGFGSHFDWEYAQERCVAHADGAPKHSVYLSVYRVLEHIPLDSIRSLYLTTRDGRTLELPRTPYLPPDSSKGYYLYQELCPVKPLVVSRLDPREFAQNITSSEAKVSVPKIIFTDLKVIDFNDLEHTGNVGSLYDRNIRHLKSCIDAVTSGKGKDNKTLDRSHVESFSFQIINHGVYVGDGRETVLFKMLSIAEIKQKDYDWGRSALIL